MKIKFYFAIAPLLLLAGCVEKDMFKDIHIYPDTSLPLGSVTVTDSSLFEMAGVRDDMPVGADGVISFVDHTNIKFSGGGTGAPLITLNTQQITVKESLGGYDHTGAFVDIVDPIEIAYSISGLTDDQVIESISFVNGSLRVDAKGLDVANYDPSQLKFTIPAIQVDGKSLVMTPGQILNLDPTQTLKPAPGNQLMIYISGRIPVMSTLEGLITLTPGSDIHSVSGYFGRKELSVITQSISIPAGFSDFTDKTNFVRFENPNFMLNITNGYNAPMMADIKSMVIDGTTIQLKPGPQGESLYIPAMGEAKLLINNSRTVNGAELSNAITKESKNITVVVSSVLNPTAQDLGMPDYVASTKNSMLITDQLNGVLDMVIPLDCIIDGVSFENDFEVDLQDLESDDMKFKQIDFTISGINELPLDLHIMPRLLGADGKHVDIFEKPIPFPASVNNMRPTDAGFKPAVIGKDNLIKLSVPEKMITQLLRSKKLYIELLASTKDAKQLTPVKIFSPSKLQLHIVLGAKADMKLSE